MKVSDYIVAYLLSQGVEDVFGYPGGMVTGLMDSLAKHKDRIKVHLTRHEQGAAFAACGYAQAGRRLGAAFATSGPGATNLITGICTAYFDSIPVLFITGQVNTHEAKGDKRVRQCGFQETDIVSMVRGVTKYTAYVGDAGRIRWHLDRAVYEATTGRKGAVLLDIPMDVMKADVEEGILEGYCEAVPDNRKEELEEYATRILEEVERSSHPVVLLGQGIKASGSVALARDFVRRFGLPAVTSMTASDILCEDCPGYGFIGAYGSRPANFIVAKSDLVLVLGARLDVRQVGKDRGRFAPEAKILRVDIDPAELDYKVHRDEISICTDVSALLSRLVKRESRKDFREWNRICCFIKERLAGRDDREPNRCVRALSHAIPDHVVVTTDVGQNQVWVSQSFAVKPSQSIFYTGGCGAMGYSLPAAIGACAATGRTVYSFNGDGGIQMNLQELQTIAEEGLPVKIIIFNNNALGMIRHFQEMYYSGNYFLTVKGQGWSNPDFGVIAQAYGLPYRRVMGAEAERGITFRPEGPEVIEVLLEGDTYVYPKLEYGRPNQDQEPLLQREEYRMLMDDKEIEKMLGSRRKNTRGSAQAGASLI